jgi:hypothetical protein
MKECAPARTFFISKNIIAADMLVKIGLTAKEK